MPYKEGEQWRATPKYRGVRGKTKVCKTKEEALEWERAGKEKLKENAAVRQKDLDLLPTTYLDDAHRLNALERVIEKNLKAFYEVGHALMEIRDSRLYLETHDTFENYCRDRWDMTRRYADSLIVSSKVVENLGNENNCSQIPATESQARPLTRLSAPLQQEAWKKAVETAPEGRITARHVKKIVIEITGEETQRRERTVKQQKRRIDESFRISESLEKAFDNLLDEVIEAWKDNWKSSSKEAVQRNLDNINAYLNINDS